MVLCAPVQDVSRKTKKSPFSIAENVRWVAIPAIAKRGVLLTTQDLKQQYDRYNASESLSTETQQLLGRVLDLIEQAARN